jgi:exopolysaccharide biosynthesis predicted pyruvyltransferase EpsI
VTIDLRTQLSDQIDEILVPLIAGRGEHICIIDPPNQTNVGDHAIFLGELDFISRHFPRARLSFVEADGYSPQADPLIEEATLLLIHGGGNFGNLWERHHRIRMRILDRFSHKYIVQLPQSIHFGNPESLKVTAEAIQKQSAFTLMVRDQRSCDFARQHFKCDVRLSPDMAFAMRPIAREPATVDVFCLLRTDKEAVVNRLSVFEAVQSIERSCEVGDWLIQSQVFTHGLDKTLTFLTRNAPLAMAPFRSAALSVRRHYARQRVEYGRVLLSRGQTVVTDRLHAHIFCCLLGIPNLIFDSYDGKISAFFKCWTRDRSEASLIQSPQCLGEFLRPRHGTANKLRATH